MHVCSPDMGCICSLQALEPDEDCPKHGYPFPPRCACGRFVKWRISNMFTHISIQKLDAASAELRRLMGTLPVEIEPKLIVAHEALEDVMTQLIMYTHSKN
jgi:hypothetical protein